MAIYVGVNGGIKNISAVYIGINGVPKEVSEICAGYNNLNAYMHLLLI